MMETGGLRGQKAVVTGANSGIGEAIAKSLAGAGASVVVNYVVNPEDAERVVSEIQSAGGEAMAIKADVSDEAQVQVMFREMFRAYKTVDILVNNAGIESDSCFAEMTLEEWNRVISINLTGQFLCAREAVREFLRRGVVPETSCAAGKVICISSVHEAIPWACHSNYAASKGGVMMLMKSMAQELAPQHIRVVSICPGAIKTPINKAAWSTKEAEAQLLKLIPSGRVGNTSDIGRVAAWLASDDADYITGTSIYVDGGMMLYPGFRTGG
jgi:glucose 1-dehydrogenase